MKRMLMLLALLLCASTMMFAQAPGGGSSSSQYVAIAAGIGMAIASGLCGIGQGMAVKGAAEGTARNPGATGAIRFALILGLVFIESLALYTLVIIFIKVV
ncbi:MAG TPA: ATP synthase F0 subunit C [Bryobacteraceae bacterium]|jgi:F-type H+-transporting ATPase subunit c|nr:ATP synthase F0 subunit C [Bryobacteraceae bacterium]